MASADGFDILGHVASNRSLFSDVAADVNKAASAIMQKRLKSKSMSVEDLRRLGHAFGTDTFIAAVEAVPDAQIKTLLGKLDKHRTDLKTANAQARRQHLLDLASGSASPAEVAKKAKSVKTPGKRPKPGAEEPKDFFGEAMRATRDRRK